MRVAIFHNLLWSKYKGVVFSALSNLSDQAVEFRFVQIAETDGQRVSLTGVDPRYHRYEYRLLFNGSYDRIPRFKLAFRLLKELSQSRADLVILPGYHRPEYWLMLTWCILTRTRRAVFCDSTARDRQQTKLKSVAKRIFFRNCHAFFVYGQRAAEYVREHGAPAKHIYVRCQAAALPPDYSTENVLAARASFRADAPKFLYVGRLSPEKGLVTLLRAFREFRASAPRATLELIGDGPIAQQLHEFARTFDPDLTAVQFSGAQPLDKIAIGYLRATALILPSESEPWGLVVNEALSYGCPVVVSDACGCVPELVLTGKTGFSFEVGSVAALRDAMTAVASLGSPSQIAEQCLTVMRSYSPEVAASQIRDGCLAVARDKWQ